MRTPKDTSIRDSAIAGTWYPGTMHGLLKTVDEYLNQVNQPLVPSDLVGLISPHAGYAYSGLTAAHAYHQLQGRQFGTVIILAPSHRMWVGDYAVSTEDAYETPLGRVALDRELIAELDARIALRPIRGDLEHSLEIQLPFLQRQLQDFALVPILMSADDPQVAQRLAAALADLIRQREERGQRVLLIASSDLHHIENYDQVRQRDQRVVDAIAAYDLDALATLLMAPSCTVCGRMPILTVLHAGKALRANATAILHHTTSGDVTGQRQAGHYTVGYLAAALYKS